MLLEMQEQPAFFLPSLCLVARFSATSIPRPSVTYPFLSLFYCSWGEARSLLIKPFAHLEHDIPQTPKPEFGPKLL